MTPPLQLIVQLAPVADAAYRTDTVLCGRTRAACNVTFVPGSGVIVAFRGSCSPEDFIHDGETWMDTLLTGGDGAEVRVHHGFLTDFDSITFDVVTQVRGWLKLYPDAPVLIIGHSLGGAQAILCALEFFRQKLPVAQVITYGQPRVGNVIFRDFYDATPLREITWRVVNENDIVPRAPGILLGYRHCGNELFLPTQGGWCVNPTLGLKLLSDVLGFGWALRMKHDVLVTEHFMASYQSRLNQLKV